MSLKTFRPTDPGEGWRSPYAPLGHALYEPGGGWGASVAFGLPGPGTGIGETPINVVGGNVPGAAAGAGAGAGAGGWPAGFVGIPPGVVLPGAGATTAAGGIPAWWGGLSAVDKVKAGVGGIGGLNSLRKSRSGGGTGGYAYAPFESDMIQNYLPPQLRQANIDPLLTSGIQGIGSLMQNPGGLAPNVSAAIAPRLAAESENIATNYRGIMQEQQGAAARTNQPVSIKGALAAALNVAQERAQRGARQEALSDSEALRRDDLEQTYKMLDALLKFTTAGRNQAVGAQTAQAGINQMNDAAMMTFWAELLSGIG